mgnify:FL=1
MKLEELQQEFDYIDERCQDQAKSDKGLNECSLHKIKHYGVAGDCPICTLRAMIEEKFALEDWD